MADDLFGGLGAVIPMFGSLLGMGMKQQGYAQAGDSARAAGARSKVALDFEAAQLDQNAGQTVAASQRDAENQRRLAVLVGSRALAVAAASGGGASDPTVVNLIADIHGEGAYRSMVKFYAGEDRARQLRMAAAGKRYEGDVAELRGEELSEAYDTRASGDLLTDGMSLFGKYGMGGPKSAGSSGGSSISSGANWVDAGTPSFTSVG